MDRIIHRSALRPHCRLSAIVSLVEFIKLGILTKKTMDDALKLAKEHNMTTVMAYILKAQQDSEEGKASFRL